jgi:hypothetical protein
MVSLDRFRTATYLDAVAAAGSSDADRDAQRERVGARDRSQSRQRLGSLRATQEGTQRMLWINLAGYAASSMVLATFCMKTMTTDCELYDLSEAKARELYLQHLSFGFAVLRLITMRLLAHATGYAEDRQSGAATATSDETALSAGAST